jgi:hypothetical protein
MTARPRKNPTKPVPTIDKQATAEASSSTTDSGKISSIADTSSPIRILKQADTPKLSPRGKGTLTYEVGVTREDADTLLNANSANEAEIFANATWLRITANQSSGYGA